MDRKSVISSMRTGPRRSWLLFMTTAPAHSSIGTRGDAMRRRLVAVIAAGAIAVAGSACGSSGDAGAPPPTVAGNASTPPTTNGATNASTPPVTGTSAVDSDELAAAIQGIIDASMVPGALSWNGHGADVSPTGVLVGVRVPGRPDILLASGTNLDDGRALDPTASFSTANLGYGIVAEIGLKLVADGTLDRDATINAWLPDTPNADRVTVGMLIDATHGWGDYEDVMLQNVTADFARRWTSGEAVATLKGVAPEAEPGTFVGGVGNYGTGMLALGYIAEQVTGRSLADLVTSTITQPAGLDHSFLSDGTDLPDNYQDGRFSVEGVPTHSTAEGSPTAYFTYAPAEDAFVSTVPDLLDLLDTWADGTWRAGATPPAPTMFPANRQLDLEHPGDLPRYLGLDVPYSGYCPCQATSDGNSVDKIGRRPATYGTDVHLFHYPVDDISIVLQYNSNATADREQIEAVVDHIRATVAASI
jgi:CubicO group peptidase (beta-lactamase class C family)